MFTYLCTPITDVKCLEFPAIRFVKMNSNLVLFDLVRMCSASVTPRSCWKDIKQSCNKLLLHSAIRSSEKVYSGGRYRQSCNKLLLHSAIRSSEKVYSGGRYRHSSHTLGLHITTKFNLQETCLEVTRRISGQFHVKLPEEHKATNKDVSFQKQCTSVTLQGNMVHSPMLHLTK